MNKSEATERLAQLKKQLQQYSYEYYVQDDTSVSDAIYDGLMRELKSIEEAFPDLIDLDSPTQRVGGIPLDTFKKVQHSSRMLSLNDVFSISDIEAWIKRIDKLLPDITHEYFCSIKLDGLACALVYQDGVFTQAITRGDGVMGEDVTANVKTISSIPLRLRETDETKYLLKGRVEIRGEIIMLKKEFESLNKERTQAGLPVFANPRNLAAGTIRQLDPKMVAERPLQFRAWDLFATQVSLPSSEVTFEVLKLIGFPVSSPYLTVSGLDNVMNFISKWENKREELPYVTDGLVIKINDRSQYERLGVVGKNPRAAIAYKYAAEEATTVVKDIVISIGRTGAATPVAVFDPVVVAGSTVRHASLHNADEINKKDIRVGDTVVIYKAGDIIPQVSKVITELRPKNTPPFIMVYELRRQYPELEFERPEGEAVYRVKGVTAPLLLKRSLEHFASKGAMDIDTLGEKNVAALVDSGLVQDLADIYTINKEQLLQIERFAELSANNLIEAIAAKKQPPLHRFVYGLGIRHVGAQTALDLANAFHRLDSLGTASYADLKEVDGVGEIVAESILAWFSDDDNEELLSKFRKLNVWPQDAKPLDGPLKGKKFVVTGSLQTMGRDMAAEKIRSLGGTFQSAIAKDTDFLVVGENVGVNKLAKADKLGIKRITEDDLLLIIK